MPDIVSALFGWAALIAFTLWKVRQWRSPGFAPRYNRGIWVFSTVFIGLIVMFIAGAIGELVGAAINGTGNHDVAHHAVAPATHAHSSVLGSIMRVFFQFGIAVGLVIYGIIYVIRRLFGASHGSYTG
jgi:hypothetical protein